MLPLQQAYEVRAALLEYVRATFHFADSDVEREFHRFVSDEKTGLFRGPFVSLKTPFVKAGKDDELPLEVQPPFAPHLHQVKAFRRLTTVGGHAPQPTLLTTGTGSGKTECFLYPILDYVYDMNRMGRREGVKVIIMYPMNALATDQAKRMAEVIWADSRLRGTVTAGLLIGDSKDPSLPSEMGEHNVIEYRDAIVGGPVPDILLTNFKMLDYALIRQEYRNIWHGNLGEGVERAMLRFFVIDELHTFDGAQGTDVANLIRRVKLKLHMAPGDLTPIGTSATLGTGPDAKSLLCDYATQVFGVPFGEDAIITEERVTADEFFGDDLTDELPTADALRALSRDRVRDAQDYLREARRAWLGDGGANADAVALGRGLRRMRIVRDLVEACTSGIKTLGEIRESLMRRNSAFRELMADAGDGVDYAGIIIESLLTLIASAREEGGKFPLLFTQVQLWERELSGIQRIVQSDVEFTWRDKSAAEESRISLPMYFCRDCGATGWLTTKKETETKYGLDAKKVNRAFMNREPEVRLMSTDTENHRPAADFTESALNIEEHELIRTADLTFAGKGETDEGGLLRVIALRRGRSAGRKQSTRFDCRCPLCMSDSLSVVGGRTSTLSSVGVSQVMASDFDSQDPAMRKMLCFSNSVQDAAHLAGFYEIRTFRFLFRQSIRHYLKSVGHAVTLRELQEGFKSYWKAALRPEEYYHRFMPGDLVELVDLRRQYRDPITHELTGKFKREFDLRVDWEICSEFGFMSQIGRTLEKMGSAATLFRRATIEEAHERMKTWLAENNLGWIAERRELFVAFVNGLLHRLRIRGGIDHEFMRLFRTVSMKSTMLNWPRAYRNEHFLHKRFGGNRLPMLLSTQPGKTDEEYDSTRISNRRTSWFKAYFVRALAEPAQTMEYDEERASDFYAQLLSVLTSLGVLTKQTAGRTDNYALSPDAILVEPTVRGLKCERCESRLFVGGSDDMSEGTHCLDFTCGDATYSAGQDVTSNYYQRVYDRATSPRIFANEHTGLLEREEREALEHDFRDHPQFNSCNVLTATSTLEMGIDIGSLNVVALVGVPPAPANFLQRVGRAGRKEGAALVLNFAKTSTPHDLNYFSEPKAMMEGEVGTPGCFLEARDILRRHFYAYCIDTWVSANVGNKIPNRLQYAGQSYDALTAPEFFANRVRRFVEGNIGGLVDAFRGQYPEGTQPVIDEIRQMVESGRFFEKVIEPFRRIINTQTALRKQFNELSERLEHTPEHDEELRKEIGHQRDAIAKRLKTIGDYDVIEFMTDQGVLPNYGFPEEGIELAADIRPEQAPGDDTPLPAKPEAIDPVRPGRIGIRELAPGNTFYTHKMRLPVNGLSIDNRKDDLHTFRFCSNCDALASETMTDEFNAQTCPKCGDPSWANNKHHFLRFLKAVSNVSRRDAVMRDEEDRDSELFNTMRHFRFTHTGQVTSFGIRKVGFGIEFCKDVMLTEVNYGSRKQLTDPIRVNGDDNQFGSLGFVTCTCCGHSVSTLENMADTEARKLHHAFCPRRDVPYPADEEHKETWISPFLYRELPTEAIKVLLPVSLFDTEETLAIFKAGLQLGMRQFYKSSADHLRVETYCEYNQSTKSLSNYLVIYDDIPGGTGYLAKLCNTTAFSRLIRLAYEALRDCSCRLEGKDGCYRCILSYGNQLSGQRMLSRAKAEDLFAELCRSCDNWETIDGPIGCIMVGGESEQSVLERDFVSLMGQIAKERQWTWQRVVDPVEESVSYVLTIRGADRELTYDVFPQYPLGPEQGVEHYTIPDFQFIFRGGHVGGADVEPAAVPQWSVFTDGYEFHVGGGNMRFYGDLQKREAIRKSNLNAVRKTWTLTWDDVMCLKDPDRNPDTITDDISSHNPDRQQLEDFPNELHKRRTNVDRLLFMLEHPDVETLAKEAFSLLASCFTEKRCYASHAHIADALRENAHSEYAPKDRDEPIFARTTFIGQTSLTDGSAWYDYDAFDHYTHSVRYTWGLKMGLSDIKRDDWEGFWHRYNLLQLFADEENLEQEESHAAAAPSADEPSEDRADIIGRFPGLEEIVGQLLDHGVAFDHDGGFELEDDEGVSIIAEAAIGLVGRNVVIDNFEGREDEVEAFRAKGYTVIDAAGFDINVLL